MPVSVTKRGPGLADLKRNLDRIRKSDVLVGIPAAKTLRKSEPINNASLLFVHTHGSPLKNIPARPVLEPSIEANRNVIAPHLAGAAKATLQEHPQEAERELNRAGTIAENGAKRWFTDPRNGWAPNAPSTIAQKGSDKPLIDTGALRRSITHVVRVNGQVKESGAPETHLVRVNGQAEESGAPEAVVSGAEEALEAVAEGI